MDLRPIPDDEAGEELFARYVEYAFSPEDGPEVTLDEDRPDPPAQAYGLYGNDPEPVSVCASYDLQAHLRGTTLPIGGVSAVATPPEHRRRGHVETMLRELCRNYRATDTPMAALWAFKHTFYAAFGWATCSRRLSWTAAPSTLRSAAAFDGDWERVNADAWRRLDAVYEAATEGRPLALDRTEAWWRERTLRGWETDPYVSLWTDDDGDSGAYVCYTVETADDGQRLRVADHAARDLDAFRHVLGFLANHDSQVTEATFDTAVDSPLHALVENPDELTSELSVGPLARVVDVAGALEPLTFPIDAEATLVLGVDDPLLDSVTGRYELSVANGAATVERRGDDPAGADAQLGVGALAQLAVGVRAAPTLAQTDALAADSETVRMLDRLFPETTPYLRERF
ncbi:enhanced intracellular survival protein Eis [Halosegnis sp.]|uniref:GNAT family N-acetyltransferase n=1 Tax=Halosegnis sp. TaxID=2864959 RepID=UPI0035D5130B